MLGERFTSRPGSSQYFIGGFITYYNAMKMELLGVSPETLAEHGAVSKETAEAMALGARRRTRSTYALSITGAAGPDPGTETAPKGTMVVGLADAAGVISVQRQFLRRPPADTHLHRTVGTGLVAPPDNRTSVGFARYLSAVI